MKHLPINRFITHVSFAYLIGCVPNAFGMEIRLAPPQPGDMTVEALAPANLAAPVRNEARDSVHFSWATAKGSEVRPHVSESRGYWFSTSGAQIAKGLQVDTSAPGALVKISPKGDSPAVDPNELELLDAHGRVFKGAAGMSLAVDAEKLAASGTPFARGASAFRISPELGQGRFILRAPNLKGDGHTYHVHVQERQSNVVLQMQSAREGYLYGQNLRVDTHLKDMAGNAELPVQQISGFLRSPDGKTEPLHFQRGADGAFVGQIPLKQGAVTVPGLWEVHATVQGTGKGGGVVRRNVKTAFGYAVPQARLLDQVTIEKQEDGDLVASFRVDTGSAGRYQLRGMLCGSGAKGNMQPIMTADGAAWLEAGSGELTLIFDQTLLAASGLSAPFEVRHLQLLDQSRMEVLRRQDHALQFEL